jgi:hypothetical protein
MFLSVSCFVSLIWSSDYCLEELKKQNKKLKKQAFGFPERHRDSECKRHPAFSSFNRHPAFSSFSFFEAISVHLRVSCLPNAQQDACAN